MLPLWDSQPRRRRPALTFCLVAANLAVFAYEVWLMLQGGRALPVFMEQHALIPGRLVEGWREPEPWLTVFSSMFLHGSGAHVLGNVWFLWVFGGGVEARLGAARFLTLYFASGLGAAALQVATDPFSPVPMVGASGAISGLLGAYLVLFPGAWILTLIPWIVPVIPVPAVVFLLLWFALQTVNGVGALQAEAAGGVAWWAHIGGFLAGVLVARTIGAPRGRRR